MASKSELKRINIQTGRPLHHGIEDEVNRLNDTYDQVQQQLARTLRKREVISINPRVPTFPPPAAALAQKLREIIDANGEQATLAYAALSRLCVLWSTPRESPLKVVAEYSQTQQTVDLTGNPPIVRDLMRLMMQLFPEGEGLPPECDPQVKVIL